jgi:nicotinamidase-related amidase
MSNSVRRALLVIDVQNEYVSGDLLIEYPDIHLSLKNIGRAMDTAKEAEIPIVIVQNTAPANSPIFAKGSPGWKLHEVVTSREHDHYVEKTLPSAFAGTDLADWIAGQRIGTLTVLGYMTHNCVASTVLHALHAGLAVEVLDDATGSLPYANQAGSASAAEIHRAFNVVFQSRFAAVLGTEQWIEAVSAGKAPERDSILKSYQRAYLLDGSGG